MRAATTKIPHLLSEKDLLKTPKVMYDLFTMHEYDGDGRRNNSEIYKTKTKEKIPRLVALPSPRLRKWRSTVFRCPKTPITSWTYPRWDGGPILVGQRNTGLGKVWAVKLQRMWIIYMWTFKIFNKSGLGYGLRCKNNGDGEDLEN